MPPTRKRRSSSTDSPGMKIEVDGRTYVVREADISPKDIRALRAETGFSWAGLGRELQKDPDLDLIGALIWLARRIEGDEVDYDTILDELSYDSDMTIGVEDKRTNKPTEGGDSPEA